jgi:hypothetical protein
MGKKIGKWIEDINIKMAKMKNECHDRSKLAQNQCVFRQNVFGEHSF